MQTYIYTYTYIYLLEKIGYIWYSHFQPPMNTLKGLGFRKLEFRVRVRVRLRGLTKGEVRIKR
jgi:hypothetical protein